MTSDAYKAFQSLMRKVLVTGGTGFIGSHLVRRNLEEGCDVHVLVLPGSPKPREYEKSGIDMVYGDIRDFESVERAVEGVEVVFHLAAKVTDWAPKELFYRINVSGIRNICEASLRKGIKRFVEVSTNDVFGLREDVVIDETFDYAYWEKKPDRY